MERSNNYTFYNKIVWSLFVVLALAAPTLAANETVEVAVDHDGVWRLREAEARVNALKAYHPNPENVTKEFAAKVKISMDETFGGLEMNGTRRELRRAEGGGCAATNPIDKCWRCNANWAENRQRLADCAMGFGKGTTGGKGGAYYVVTDSSDDNVLEPKNGTLRHAVIQKEPLWIVFSQSMTIRLSRELIMQGDKTIDGRGSTVQIAGGAGIKIQFVKNVIIHSIKVGDIKVTSGGWIRDSIDHKGVRAGDEGDGISIFGSNHIWIDHVSMHNCADGIIDAVAGSTAITISNCHFTDHDKVLLFGANNQDPIDKVMQVTVAFNHFGKRLHQRMPRCRWGLFHIVNNDYTHWEMYAVGGSAGATIISQGNRYIAPPGNNFFKEVTHRDCPDDSWKSWTWVSSGDVFQNGAFFKPSGDPNGAEKYGHKDMVDARAGSAVPEITMYAGHLSCTPKVPC
ncbi:unnamed protein product [Cuscuta epithymum]|uniref:Pectate lyase n=1 Tax=Cuscuta epithymum TaxID=186058 RepID=A0AAV0E731_9ASTE|nr:unnamed protein product [Cuscuta epithymum]CAH9118601.1 unnamed protein product [Cuscuta epithymum]